MRSFLRRHVAIFVVGILACQGVFAAGLDELLDDLDNGPGKSSKSKVVKKAKPIPPKEAASQMIAEPTAVSDIVGPLESYEEREAAPAGFSGLTSQPWWSDQAEFRFPVQVSDPVGLARHLAPVSIVRHFPEGTPLDAIRAVTPGGEELPTQAYVKNAANNTVVVTFLISIGAREQAPVFVYYGKKALPPPAWTAPDDCWSVKETTAAIILCNNRMTVELNRVAGVDDVSVFRSLKCHGAAFNQINAVGTRAETMPAGTRAQVVQRGPVMTVVRYDSGTNSLTLTFYAASPFIDFSFSTPGRFAMFWLPGGDTVNDLFYCATPEGLKRKPIAYTGGNTMPTHYLLNPWLQEGWLAIQDTTRNETVGNFFNLKQLGSFHLQLLAFGYWIYGGVLQGSMQGALYCAREFDPLACRRAYIGWQYPLACSAGTFQAADPALPAMAKGKPVEPPATASGTPQESGTPPSTDPIRISDPYDQDARVPNPMYFTGLTNQLWWNDQAEFRLPVLVTEPVGLSRDCAPVSVFHSFPAGTALGSIRVVHPYGEEIPAQARVADAASNLIEVTFVLPILGRGQVPVFVYYGSKSLPQADLSAADPCLSIKETPTSLLLCNSHMAVELNQVSGADSISVFRSLKCHDAVRSQIDPLQQADGLPKGVRAQVVENGPVRKTIRYEGAGAGLTVSLVANSPALYVAYNGQTNHSLCWRPGGDSVNDTLYYETPEGIMPVLLADAVGTGAPAGNPAMPGLKEGWLAIQDRVRNEIMGAFFEFPGGQADLKTTPAGILIGVAGGAVRNGALYCSRDVDMAGCRAAYIAWKNQPRIIVGTAQAACKVVPPVPRLGRDFILMHLMTPKHHLRYGAASALDWVARTRYFGGNYVMNWGDLECLNPSTNSSGEVFPPFLDELVRTAHAAGVGVSGGSAHLNPGMVKELVRRNVDALWLADEWGWSPSFGYNPLNEETRRLWLAGKWTRSATNISEVDRADFKKRYGVDMPDTPKDDLSALVAPQSDGIEPLMETPAAAPFSELPAGNLQDPSQFALFRWMMEANNRLYADLADIARAGNSNILVTMTTSPNNLTLSQKKMGAGVHDLETLGDSLTTIAMDLYLNDINYLNMMIKHERGAMGNRRPALIISGYAGWDDDRGVELNQYLQIMFGANSLAYFVMDRMCNYRPGLGAKAAFEFIAYTGLGDFAARAHTLEYVGILWNRDEIFAGLQREGASFDYLLRLYMAAMGSIPANFVYDKYLQPALLAPYKVIIVPYGLALSDSQANALSQYVESGGNLVVEGEALRNATIARIAGVTRLGEPRPAAGMVTGVLSPLAGWSADMKVPCVPLKTSAGVEVLATLDQGAPAVTRMAAGKGQVVCLAMMPGRNVASEAGGQLFDRLVESLAGYRPVRAEPDDAGLITTVLTDGPDYMICVYNMSARPCRDMKLALQGFPGEFDSLLSLRRGTVVPMTSGKASGLNLGAYEVDFYRLVRATSSSVPPAAEVVRPAIHQALTRGMKFLKLAPGPSGDLLARCAQKQADTIYVGIFNMSPKRSNEGGAEAMLAELAKWPKVKAELIGDLQPNTIGYYDVVIVPNKTRPRKYQARGMGNWENNIRAFVEQGGGVLLLHHSVGYADASDAGALFPEIGQGVSGASGRQFKAMTDHPLITASSLHARFRHDLNNPAFARQYQEPVMHGGDALESGAPDYISVQPGQAGTLVVTDPGQAPVILAGKVGKGRVVLSGMNIGCREFVEDNRNRHMESLTIGERNILVNTVYWLGEK